jgi:hypothetical protein
MLSLGAAHRFFLCTNTRCGLNNTRATSASCQRLCNHIIPLSSKSVPIIGRLWYLGGFWFLFLASCPFTMVQTPPRTGTPVPRPTTPASMPATPVSRTGTPAPRPATPASRTGTPAPRPATPTSKPATPKPKVILVPTPPLTELRDPTMGERQTFETGADRYVNLATWGSFKCWDWEGLPAVHPHGFNCFAWSMGFTDRWIQGGTRAKMNRLCKVSDVVSDPAT